MSEYNFEDSLSDEDIEKAIEELRYVLKNAAEKDSVDRQFIMDLTKTLEELTELRINKAKPWDPRLGGVLRKIEEAIAKLGIPRGQ
jgi:hypothetical protein